jgi:hypothetical protein
MTKYKSFKSIFENINDLKIFSDENGFFMNRSIKLNLEYLENIVWVLNKKYDIKVGDLKSTQGLGNNITLFDLNTDIYPTAGYILSKNSIEIFIEMCVNVDDLENEMQQSNSQLPTFYFYKNESGKWNKIETSIGNLNSAEQIIKKWFND